MSQPPQPRFPHSDRGPIARVQELGVRRLDGTIVSQYTQRQTTNTQRQTTKPSVGTPRLPDAVELTLATDSPSPIIPETQPAQAVSIVVSATDVPAIPASESTPIRASSPAESETSTALVTVVSPTTRSTSPITYADKTQRLQAVTQLIKTLQPMIWGVVLLVVLFPLTGKYLIDQSLLTHAAIPQPTREIVLSAPDLSDIDQDIVTALKTAETSATEYANQELDQWLVELEPRVEGFLDWYFDFINQKSIEFRTPFVWTYGALHHFIDRTQPTGEGVVVANLSAAFEKEFAKRVLVPRNAQLRLENITNATVKGYLSNLSRSLGSVQSKYHLPTGEWERYLSDISLTLGEDGTLSHLSFKALTGGGTYLAAKPLLTASIGKLSGKMGAKIASGITGKVAAKAGGGALAEMGASALDPIVGLGIIAWDLLDYNHTVKVDRPILKTNVTSYLSDMKQVLLNQPEIGVMSSIRELEKHVLKDL
jgi:hypothetical protein